MTAKKQALTGIILGGLAGAGLCFMKPGNPHIMLAAAVPLGMFYGFGFAFGLDIMVRWVCGAASAGKTLTLWGAICQILTGRGLLLSLFISFFLIVGAAGIAYIPGIFIGIRRLWTERG